MAQRGPRTHRQVQEWIRVRVQADSWTAADVIRAGPPTGLTALWPSDRTIQDLVKRFRPLAPATPAARWTLRIADRDDHPADRDADPAVILAALRDVMKHTQNRIRSFTVEEARWVALISRAVPGITGWAAYEAAKVYIEARNEGRSTSDLDQWLAHGGPDREPWWLFTPATEQEK